MEALENGTGDKTESSTQTEIVTPTVWGQLSLVRIQLVWGRLCPTTSLPGMVQSSPGTVTPCHPKLFITSHRSPVPTCGQFCPRWTWKVIGPHHL